MHERRSAKEKHTTWQEVKDYYDRGQSVILYQHRPQMTKKACIQSVLGFQNSFLHADHTCFWNILATQIAIILYLHIRPIFCLRAYTIRSLRPGRACAIQWIQLTEELPG